MFGTIIKEDSKKRLVRFKLGLHLSSITGVVPEKIEYVYQLQMRIDGVWKKTQTLTRIKPESKFLALFFKESDLDFDLRALLAFNSMTFGAHSEMFKTKIEY